MKWVFILIMKYILRRNFMNYNFEFQKDRSDDTWKISAEIFEKCKHFWVVEGDFLLFLKEAL